MMMTFCFFISNLNYCKGLPNSLPQAIAANQKCFSGLVRPKKNCAGSVVGRFWHAACNIQGKHQNDALKKYKGGNHNGFIKRWISSGRRLEIRRWSDQHDSYLYFTLLAAWFLYA